MFYERKIKPGVGFALVYSHWKIEDVSFFYSDEFDLKKVAITLDLKFYMAINDEGEKVSKGIYIAPHIKYLHGEKTSRDEDSIPPVITHEEVNNFGLGIMVGNQIIGRNSGLVLDLFIGATLYPIVNAKGDPEVIDGDFSTDLRLGINFGFNF